MVLSKKKPIKMEASGDIPYLFSATGMSLMDVSRSVQPSTDPTPTDQQSRKFPPGEDCSANEHRSLGGVHLENFS